MRTMGRSPAAHRSNTRSRDRPKLLACGADRPGGPGTPASCVVFAAGSSFELLSFGLGKWGDAKRDM